LTDLQKRLSSKAPLIPLSHLFTARFTPKGELRLNWHPALDEKPEAEKITEDCDREGQNSEKFDTSGKTAQLNNPPIFP
jgi:hypothetical protein